MKEGGEMAGWSTSYRFAGRSRSNVVGLMRHNMRDVDRANGIEVEHSNDDVDASRTSQNVTMVNDGNGRFIPCTDVNQAVAFMDKRIGEAKNTRTLKDGRVVPVAVRKDASTTVEMILQLDPDFTGECVDMSPAQVAETKRLLGEMIEKATEHAGGPQNVVTWSEHWDEGKPHVQMIIIPMTENNVLSMKQQFGGAVPGKKATKQAAQARYVELHDSMREHLRSVGYDATDERVDGGKKHLGLEAYKAQKDAEVGIEVRESHVAMREARMTNFAKSLDAREAGLETREAEAATKASEALRDTNAARRALQTVRELQGAAQRAIDELEDQLVRLESKPADFEGFLDQRLTNGQTLRPLFEKHVGKAQEARRVGVRKVIAKAAPVFSDPTAGHAGLE